LKQLSFKKFIPGIIWFFIVLVAICIPRADIPKVSSWLDLLLDLDKMIHAAMFGVLAFLAMYPFNNKDIPLAQQKKIFLRIAIFTSCWGYVTECIQLFIPGRSYDLVDWTADSIGVVIAFICYRWYIDYKNSTL